MQSDGRGSEPGALSVVDSMAKRDIGKGRDHTAMRGILIVDVMRANPQPNQLWTVRAFFEEVGPAMVEKSG